MEIAIYLILLLILLVLVVFWLLYIFRQVIKRVLNALEFFLVRHFERKPWKPLYFPVYNIPDRWKKLLIDEYPFYRKLSDTDKRRFHHRLNRFARYRRFRAIHGMVLNERHIVLISAEAIKLSFYWWNYRLTDYPYISVSPEAFYSRLVGAKTKGLTVGSGYIYFSWADFEEGLRLGDDNLRLGLHEFTHAYFLQARKAGVWGENSLTIYGERLLSLWRDEKIRNRIQSLGVLRDYAFGNQMEFAAVVIEVYFESPELLRERIPFLYELVEKLLNRA